MPLARSNCNVGQSIRNPRSAQTMMPTDWPAMFMYWGLMVSGGFSLYAATPSTAQPPSRRQGKTKNEKRKTGDDTCMLPTPRSTARILPFSFYVLRFSSPLMPPIHVRQVDEDFPPPGRDREPDKSGNPDHAADLRQQSVDRSAG